MGMMNEFRKFAMRGNLVDLADLREAFFSTDGGIGWNPNVDIAGPAGEPDGVINLLDLQRFKQMFFGDPGPSGLLNICSCVP